MKDSWNPLQYERFQKERDQPFFDLLTMIEGQGFAKAIDLGCGTGALTVEMQRRLKVASCEGIDSSAAMIARSSGGEGLSFRVQAIEDWSAEGGYDLILSNAALHWCEQHPRLFQKLHAGLRTNGQLAVQMPANHDYPTHVALDELASEEPFVTALQGRRRPRSILPPEDYAVLLHRLGFREQAVELRVYAHVLAERNEVIEWVKGSLLTFYQSALPPDLYEEFLREYQAKLFLRLGAEKPFLYPFKRLFLWARK